MKQSEQNKLLLEEVIQFQLNMEEKYPNASIPTSFELITPATWTATYDDRNEMVTVEWGRVRGVPQKVWNLQSTWVTYRLFVNYIKYEDDKYIMLDCCDGCSPEDYVIVLLKSEELKKGETS